MKKGMLQEIFKKLRKVVDFELLFYAIIIALSFWFIFWTLTLKAGGKENEIQIEETTYIEQSQNTYAPEKETISDIVELDIDEAQLLMKLARSEAGDNGVESQLLVMNVVLNRVNDERFPDSIKDVIYAKNQFAVVSNGVMNKIEPNSDSHLALARLECGEDISEGALYFESCTNKKNSWHKTQEFLFEKYGQRFYK